MLNIIIFCLFFYKINKGDLPLMSSWVFWRDFINSINFFGEAMIKLSLWSEKSVIQRVFEPQTTFKQRRSLLPLVFLCSLDFVS